MSFLSALPARLTGAGLVFLLTVFALGYVSADDALAAPENDNFPGATVASLPYSQLVNTTGATTEPDEPSPTCGFGLFSESVEHTAWWNFTPTESATYAIDLTTDGAFSALLGVWRESEFPAGGLASIGCAAVPVIPGFPLPPHTRMSFMGVAGETYYFQLGGSDPFEEGVPTQGVATLAITRPLPPVNDQFGDAIEIPSLPYEADVDMTGATVEPGEPETGCLHLPVRLGTTAWYSYTSPTSQDVLVDLLDSYSYPVAAVWSGQPGALTEEGCGLLFSFHAEPGQTYYVQVGEWYSDDAPLIGGIAHLRMEELVVPECPALSETALDPEGDPAPPDDGFPFGPVVADVKQIRYGTNAEVACFQFEFDSLPAADSDDALFTSIGLSLDTDSNADTGFLLDPGDEYLFCGQQGPLGIEVDVYGSIESPVIPIYVGFLDIAGYAYVSRTGSTVRFTVPLDHIGGDQSFDFVSTTQDPNFNIDCAPDVGAIRVSGPVIPAFGDLNCNGAVGADDGIIVLSMLAGGDGDVRDGCPQLGEVLPWSYPSGGGPPSFTAGDVDCDGAIAAVDALAIVRSAAGLPIAVQVNCPPIGTPPL